MSPGVLQFSLAVLCLTALTAQAGAQQLDAPLDCVIEPKSTISLGSGEEGLLAAVNVERGQIVKKGEVVAALDSELQKFAVEVAKLRAAQDVEVESNLARLKFQDQEKTRVEGLRRKQFTSEQRYEEVSVERRLAELAVQSAKLEHSIAQVELANAEARLERRFIRSPVDGVVAKLEMSNGEYVHEQATVMVIAELSRLNVEVFAPVELYPTIAVGDIAEVSIGAPINVDRRARVTIIDKVFDAASATFGVRLEMDNADFSLPAGLRCKVRFLVDPADAEANADREIDFGGVTRGKAN